MLIGKNIKLRPLSLDDLGKTHQWRNDLDLIKLTQGIKFPKTLEMDKEWFENTLNDKSNRNIYFGIDMLNTNEFIGIVQLNQIDYISGTALLGFVIGDINHRGKGFGFELLSLVIDYAFFTLNLRKITTYNISNNDSTFFLQKKIGFIQEGNLRSHIYQDGNYLDVVVLSLFRINFTNNNDR